MESKKVNYQFSAKPYESSTTVEKCGWTFVSLPQEMSKEIRENFKHLEEGWGRMKVTAQIGNSQWQTAIWFDTKQDTYLLPLKAVIRKKEKVVHNQDVNITLLFNLV